jgi:hypothetical protein
METKEMIMQASKYLYQSPQTATAASAEEEREKR